MFLILTGGVVLFALAIVGWYIGTYNGLVASRNACQQSWSNVEVELKRRLDLIGNLVETVKGYATHERETLERVIAARGRAASAATPADSIAAEGALTQALRGLLAVVENYPQLKADQGFRDLQAELTATEDRIAVRRNAYNGTANMYKNRCEQFPGAIVAGLHRFAPMPFFDVPDELIAEPPKVKF